MLLYQTLMNLVPGYKEEIRETAKYLAPIPNNLDYYVLGSTTGFYAYDFQGIGINGFNGAIEAQTVSYDYRLLLQYHKKIKTGGVIIWSPCLFSLYVSEYNEISRHIRYYYILEKSNIYNYNINGKVRAVSYPLLRLLKHSLFPINDKTFSLEETARNRYIGWKKEFSLDDDNVSKRDDRDNTLKYTISYLNKIISLCRENNFNFTIVIPPVSTAMTRYIHNEDLERYLISHLKRLDKDIPVFNYFCDDFFSDNRWFFSADCMNETGRKLFTKEVVEKVGRFYDQASR